MQQTERVIAYSDLNVHWPYGAIRLDALELVQQMGDHARLYFTGTVDAEQEEAIAMGSGHHDRIELKVLGQERTLFMGQLQEIGLQVVRSMCRVSVTAVSHTYELDIGKKTRSFQKVDARYIDVVDHILEAYPGSAVIDRSLDKLEQGTFMMQYQETDWAFLRRLASHAGADLVPDMTAHSSRFWVGIPEGRRQVTLENVPYTIQREMDAYRETSANGQAAVNETDYTSCRFELETVLEIGDEVLREGQAFVITKRVGTIGQGALRWEYVCALPQGLKRKKTYNLPIIGAAIEGSIIKVSRNQVKIHLDIDEAQGAQDACWFPYAAEGNQVWYLMPEIGSKVKLYFPSAEEDDAMVIQSVRHAPQGEFVEKSGRKMQDPGVKSFGNPQGKEITLGNHDLTMTAKEGLLYITMQSGIGVFMDSATRIRVDSSADLELTGRSVMLYGDKSLHIQTMSDTLELGDGFKASSGQIKMELTSSQSYAPIKSAFEQQRDELGLSGLIEKRAKRNKAVRAQGKQDAFIEGAKGLWSFVVDAVEIGSPAVLLGEFAYEKISGNKLAPLAERNSIAEAAVSGTKYIAEHVKNGAWGEMASDAVEHVKKQLYEDYVEPIETKYKGDFRHNPLVTSEEENRKLGEADFKEMMIVVDVGLSSLGISEVKAAIKTLRSAVKSGKKIDMTDLKKGASENKAQESDHGEGAGKRPRGHAEGDSASSGPPKDGMLKSNGSGFTNPTDAMKALLEKMMKEMKDNSPYVIVRTERPVPAAAGLGMHNGPRYPFTIMKREDYNALYSSANDRTGGGGSGWHGRDKRKRRDEEGERKRHDEEGPEGTGKDNLYDKDGKYNGRRNQEELDDLARDPASAGKIEPKNIREREVGLAVEERGDLGRIIRDPQAENGAEFIDTTTGLKWDVKSFESYPSGDNGVPITNPKKGAFTIQQGMKKLQKEFNNGNNVIIDTRKMEPEHIEQLKKAIDEAGAVNRIIWYP
ncbi:phage late control D family protein [Paenibacillus sp. MZ04-78.2]|uniref:contractile injection system protein, VgrG/Pvc8 family n=1 Tax=Paenibacillus sp. MZ04-78.2 TaxID=2962034 RepID=UPI0020B8E036|nr:contractile injection system protein, VgrG/Pvc8 family [Paenibacillus sp. MZ04-78.2]MCP3776151.1 phage late control D family protein [Paenibacillus sp. MZ04-78.2]